MSEPFDLAALKAKAEQRVADDAVREWDDEHRQRCEEFGEACAPDQVLALHAALVRYRQQVAEQLVDAELWGDVPKRDGLQLALAAFDQAVTL